MNASRPSLHTARLVGIALLLCRGAGVSAQPPAPRETAIIGATVITMRGAPIANATILLRDSLIVAVGRDVRVPANARRIDAAGKFVMPGLIDMHAHLFADEWVPDSVAPHELGLYLAHGVTTARLMIGTPLHHALRRRARAGDLVGPRLWIASPEFSGKPQAHGTLVRSVDDARAGVQSAADSGYDFIKITTDITPSVYDAIMAAATTRGMRVVGHVDPRVGALRAIAAGQQIEHLDAFMEAVLADSAPSRASVSDVGAYRAAAWTSLDYVDDRKVEALAGAVARRGVPVTPTLAFFRSWFGERPTEDEVRARPDYAFIPAAMRDPWMRSLAVLRRDDPGLARRERFIRVRNRMVRAIVDSGGRVMAGSDGPGGMMSYGWMLHRELAALVDAGLTPQQALEAATTVPATWLGGAQGTGRIEAGQRADLLILDANPLTDIHNTQRIRAVVSHGAVFDRARLDQFTESARRRLGGS